VDHHRDITIIGTLFLDAAKAQMDILQVTPAPAENPTGKMGLHAGTRR